MTTDGIGVRRKVASSSSTSTPTASTSTTSSESTSKGTSAALRGLDALDAVKGTSTSTKTGQGAKAALVGLAAVEKRGGTWRAAIAGALAGLAMLTSGPQLPSISELTRPMQAYTRLEPAPIVTEAGGSPPPAPRNAITARIIARSGNELVVELPAPMRTDVIAAARVTTPSVTTPSVTTPAATTPTRAGDVAVEANGGLPLTVATLLSGMQVVHGTDPGDFYCEHAFFTTTQEAFKAGSSILRNDRGEVLTGFMHVPTDRFTYARDDDNKVQSQRHSDRRDIVGAAILGFFEDARPQIGDGPFRMLLTGYLQWGSTVDNPTGDFVAHQENIDAAMKRAFGMELITREGKVLDSATEVGGMSRDRIEYLVRDASSSTGVRAIVIEAARLPVTDEAINGGSSSLQSLIAAHRPHAVMSMGVSGSSPSHQAEFHADDGGLAVDDGGTRHDDRKSPGQSHPDNYALGRAIHRGQDLIDARPILVATLGTSGDG